MNNGVNSGYRTTDTMDPAGRSPDEIQQEIRQTRSQMDDTLDAIQQRLSPGNLMEEAIRYLRQGGGNDFAHNLNESIKRNPVPVTLMGIGLAWLMMSGKEGRYAPDRADSSHLGERMSSMKDTLGSAVAAGRDKLSGAKESLSSAGSSMRDRLSQASDRVSHATDRLSHASSRVSDRAGSAGSDLRDQAGQLQSSARYQASRLSDSARYGAQRARSGFDTMLHEQPLLLGAIGIALGAALGSMLPATRQEDELMGEARDRMAGEVKQQARLQLRKGKRVAQAAGEAASQAAEEEAARQQEGSSEHQSASSGASDVRQQGAQPTPGL